MLNTCPLPSALADLYVTKSLSTRDIGKMYGVSKTQVLRWMKRFGIDRRPLRFEDRVKAGLCPDKETLNRLVHVENHSYAAVAEMWNVSEHLIHMWLDRYGLPRSEAWVTRRKGEIITLPDAATIERLYIDEGMSVVAIGQMYGVSDRPITTIMENAGIERRPDGWSGKMYDCIDGHTVRSVYERRVDNWLSLHRIAHEVEPEIPGLPGSRADFLANGWYIEVWGVQSNAAYAERMQRKIAHYKVRGLPFIGLTPWMFCKTSGFSWERHVAKVHQAPTLPKSAGVRQLPLGLRLHPR